MSVAPRAGGEIMAPIRPGGDLGGGLRTGPDRVCGLIGRLGPLVGPVGVRRGCGVGLSVAPRAGAEISGATSCFRLVLQTPPVRFALLRLLFRDPNSFSSALVQLLVDSTRGRRERPQLLLASRHVHSDAGQDIFCRCARNFLTDLRCSLQGQTRSASDIDMWRAIARKNGVAGGSALR